MDLTPEFSASFQDDLDRLFQWRRDVRHFRTDIIADAVLDRLLATACLAPSVGLSEPWLFVRVDNPQRRHAIRQNFLRANTCALSRLRGPDAEHYARLKLSGLDCAPHHIAVFADPDPAQGRGLGRDTMPHTPAYSAVMAIHGFWLAARALGIGVGWVSILEPKEVPAILDIDPGLTFIGYLCVGYPAETSDTPELAREGWEQRNPQRQQWARR